MKTNKEITRIIICIFFAFLVWLTNKLTTTYKEKIFIEIVLNDISQKKIIETEVEASGFSILKYRLFRKKIPLNTTDLINIKENSYIFPKKTLLFIDNEVLTDVSVRTIFPDTLKINNSFNKK